MIEGDERTGFRFTPGVIISYLDDDACWDAYLVFHDRGRHLHAEFTDRDEAIAWGKARCERVRVQIPGTSEYPYV